MTELHATVTLRDAVTFDATADSGHTVVLDSPEVTGGGNAGFRPLELLLVSAGGCAGIVTTALLRRGRHDFTGYEVRVRGTRAESHPMVFTDIEVEHVLRGHRLDRPTLAKTIAMAAAKYCPVVIMLAQGVRVRHVLTVVDADTGETATGALGD